MKLKDVLTGNPMDYFLLLMIFFFLISAVMLFTHF